MIWKLEVVRGYLGSRSAQKSSLYSRTLPVNKRGKQIAATYIISIAWSKTLCSYYYIETILVVQLIKIMQNLISGPSGEGYQTSNRQTLDDKWLAILKLFQ